jgi:tetratricopeptide (TPR) repeat protein
MNKAAFASLLLAGAVMASPVAAQVKVKKPVTAAPGAAGVDGARAERDAILATVAETGDAKAGLGRAEALFESVIAFSPVAPGADLAPLREAAGARRLMRVLSRLPVARAKDAARLLGQCPRVAEALAWTIKPQDDLAKVMGVLQKLAGDKPQRLEEVANLAVAIAVVYDEPVPRFAWGGAEHRVRVKMPGAAEAFEYFYANEGKMQLGLKGMPTDLLVYVVDLTESKDDWQWALGKYNKSRKLGELYDVVKYDTDFFIKGGTKKWVEPGWSLQNILRCGGVCEDRAYFVAGVAKANGVPAAFTTGRSAEVGHAWVGVLEVTGGGKSAAWNFSYGRFGDYNNLRGTVNDPQTGERVADSTVSLLSESLMGDSGARRDAQALTDAAEHLTSLRGAVFSPAKPQINKPLAAARKAEMDAVLELLDAGLRRCPSFVPGWRLLAGLSEDDRFTTADKKRWGSVLTNLCGTKYPDFALEILTPLVQSVPEHNERQAQWDWTARQFQGRPDLVANIRFMQGAAYEKAGDRAKAWDTYQDVITRHLNAGPFGVQALLKCEDLLKESGKESQALPMYADAFKRAQKPSSEAPEFRRQSNWFRIGAAYLRLLQVAGREQEAGEVATKLGLRSQ